LEAAGVMYWTKGPFFAGVRMGREGVKHPCGSLSCLAATEIVPHDNCGMWSSNALSY